MPGTIDAHRRSSIHMLVAGVAFLSAADLLQTEVIGLFGAGLLAVPAVSWGAVAHAFWYAEWKAATGVVGRPSQQEGRPLGLSEERAFRSATPSPECGCHNPKARLRRYRWEQ